MKESVQPKVVKSKVPVSPYIGGNSVYGGPTDFLKIKEKQCDLYLAEAKRHEAKGRSFAVLHGLAWTLAVITVIMAVFSVPFAWFTFAYGYPGVAFDTALAIVNVIFAVGFITSIGALRKMRNNHSKSAVLLRQLAAEVTAVATDSGLDLKIKKMRIVQLETNFLNNDDELYTKKYIWTPFLQFKHDKSLYQTEAGQMQMFLPTESYWKDGQLHYHAPAMQNYIDGIPALWTQENPLNLDNDDSDFVFLNWRIKRRIRDLFFAGDMQTFEVLDEIGSISKESPVVFERMLRHKKISKKLKFFKRVTDIRYLTPAAKMNLVAFVDGVLQDRPYQNQCDAMIDLMAQKNVQIERYTQTFWQVHRRSMKFYVAEAAWMLMIIPVFIGFLALWTTAGFLPGFLLFLAGGSAVAFGEMAMMTRQIRDMKAKKLTPNLISSLVAIRHNMCSDSVMDDEVVYQYENDFKAAEKRFMLTVTEIEAVKMAKENVSDKVTERLTAPAIRLRQNKEAQAQIYYEKFNHYRKQCLIFGAIEVAVLIAAVPFVLVALMAFLAFPLAEGLILMISLIAIAVALIVEWIMFRNHIRVARRKELYLLIYQKMSVLLSNYKLFNDPVYLATELHTLENSVVRAAEIDNMKDVSDLVSSVAVVNITDNSEQLANAHNLLQVKQDIGTNSVDRSQFQGNLNALIEDFADLGTSE